jgi:photosystem II stability/assembly factor-like uncharacterized protein
MGFKHSISHGLARSAVVAVLLVAGLAAAPSRADAEGPSIVVSSTAGLVDGSLVGIDGTGFDPSTTIDVAQCAGSTSAPPVDATACDETTLDDSVATDSTGNYVNDPSTSGGTHGYSVAVLPRPGTSSPAHCDGTTKCVLYIGEELQDFSRPHVFVDIAFDPGATASHWRAHLLPPGISGTGLMACPTRSDCRMLGVSASGYELLVSSDGGWHWDVEPMPLDAQTASPGGLACPTTTECILGVGQALAGHGYVVRTDDTGGTWTTESLPDPNFDPGTISCPSATDCWMVGGYANGEIPTDDDTVLATTDGGVTWTADTLPVDVFQTLSISCPTTSNCWLTATALDSTTAIYATNDGGTTWNLQTSVPESVAGPRSISCATNTTCTATGSNGVFTPAAYATANGGSTWSAQTLPGTPAAEPGSISCTSATTCFVVSSQFTPSNPQIAAFATDDGGQTWNTQPLPQTTGYNDNDTLTCVDDQTCWIAAFDVAASLILSTTDGGGLASTTAGQSQLTTTATDPASTGTSLMDTALLSNVTTQASGNVAFAAYGPTDPNCEGEPVFIDSVSVHGPGTYVTQSFRPPDGSGNYHWTATYSGDDVNQTAQDPCGSPGETSTVDSTIWAGYIDVDTPSQPVTAKITIPTLDCSQRGKMSAWVGYDGDTNDTVEQAGFTAQCSSSSGPPAYSLWWELFPATSITIRLANLPHTRFHLAAGEVVQPTVYATDGILSFSMQVTDANGKLLAEPWSTTMPTASLPHHPTFFSSECIVEDPLVKPRRGPVTQAAFASFSAVQFDGCSAIDGAAGTNDLVTTRLLSPDLSVVKAAPGTVSSMPDGDSTFSVAWLSSANGTGGDIAARAGAGGRATSASSASTRAARLPGRGHLA